MKPFLFGMAYFLILTTPISVGFVLWIYWEIFSTDQTITSLSMHLFLQENLNFLHVWVYSWFLNSVLDFFWAFPAAFLSTFKLVVNTWLGLYLLRVAWAMPSPPEHQPQGVRG